MNPIKLNDEQYSTDVKKVFNNGQAGIVKGVTATVKRKTAEDHENAPDYSLIITDAAGGQINRGYYRRFTDSTGKDWSEKRLVFFVKEMKHLMGLVDANMPDEVASYEKLLDMTMKAFKEGSNGKIFNVGVAYGTIDRPRRFLEINNVFALTPPEETPYLGKNPQMVRIEPDNPEDAFKVNTGSETSDDDQGDGLPW